MSIIAVKVTKTKIIIGADSIVVRGSTQVKKPSKLFKINSLIIGGCGASRDLGFFKSFCKTQKPEYATEHSILDFMVDFNDWATKKCASYKLEDSAYLLIFLKKVFYIHQLYISEVNKYFAIGAGEDFALAALYLGKSVKKAIQSACHLSIYCEEPIVIYTLRK